MDLNIDWDSRCCTIKKLLSSAETYSLSQVIAKPTRIRCRAVNELQSKAISGKVGCSDHNLKAVAGSSKVPELDQNVIVKRMFKYFNESTYC